MLQNSTNSFETLLLAYLSDFVNGDSNHVEKNQERENIRAAQRKKRRSIDNQYQTQNKHVGKKKELQNTTYFRSEKILLFGIKRKIVLRTTVMRLGGFARKLQGLS